MVKRSNATALQLFFKRDNPLVTFDKLKFNLMERSWKANIRKEVKKTRTMLHGPLLWSQFMDYLCGPDTRTWVLICFTFVCVPIGSDNTLNFDISKVGSSSLIFLFT